MDILSKTKKEIIIVTNKYNNQDYDKYKKQYNNVELVINNTFHDRFIIIDKKIIYHCGSSFKDLGKKCFEISKIEDNDILHDLLKRLWYFYIMLDYYFFSCISWNCFRYFWKASIRSITWKKRFEHLYIYVSCILDYNEDVNKVILNKFNIDIEKGMFLGIAGPSGCGKSSLIKAICKLEQGHGEISIDSRNIESLSRKDISEIIALVPQKPFLIAGTIYENICYGIEREVSLQEVEEATKKAFIYDYINGLPNKFDSQISEGGDNLSGGQRQRIAIARVFLRKPKILILDEATSALDNTSEKYIQTEIEKLQKENNTTIISIAHRLTTLKNCDRIIVLDKGKIEESGKFNELIEKDGIFSDMYYGKLN